MRVRGVQRHVCGVLRGCNLAAVPTPGQRLLLAPVHCTQAASCHAQLAAGAKWQAQGARLVRGTGAGFGRDERALAGVELFGTPQ